MEQYQRKTPMVAHFLSAYMKEQTMVAGYFVSAYMKEEALDAWHFLSACRYRVADSFGPLIVAAKNG